MNPTNDRDVPMGALSEHFQARSIDVVALGELLIDFTPIRSVGGAVPCYEQNPGGAPANVLVAISRLGGKTSFIGKVGDDQFGHFLRDVLVAEGVRVEGLRITKDADTTLAFVHLDQAGDRSFSFYRRSSADTQLTSEEVDERMLANSRVFHFGSVSMTHMPSRQATLAAVKLAKKHGCIVSHDPNWRPLLWGNRAEAMQMMTSVLGDVDVLKVSEEELAMLTEEQNVVDGAHKLQALFGIKLVLVTLGARGCFFVRDDDEGHVPAFAVRTVDTTGAGDTFLGTMLIGLLEAADDGDIGKLSVETLNLIIRRANAAAAICTERTGAIPAMPEKSELAVFLEANEGK